MSAAKMVADSTQGDLDEPKKKRKRKKDNVKKSKKPKKKDSKKRKESKNEDEDSDLDLEIDLQPIGNYIRERQEMNEQLFHCLRGPSLQRYIPDVVKELSLEELKKRCLEHLEIMSKKRIRRILSGDDPASISSSGTEEETSGEEEDIQEVTQDVEEDKEPEDHIQKTKSPGEWSEIEETEQMNEEQDDLEVKETTTDGEDSDGSDEEEGDSVESDGEVTSDETGGEIKEENDASSRDQEELEEDDDSNKNTKNEEQDDLSMSSIDSDSEVCSHVSGRFSDSPNRRECDDSSSKEFSSSKDDISPINSPTVVDVNSSDENDQSRKETSTISKTSNIRRVSVDSNDMSAEGMDKNMEFKITEKTDLTLKDLPELSCDSEEDISRLRQEAMDSVKKDSVIKELCNKSEHSSKTDTRSVVIMDSLEIKSSSLDVKVSQLVKDSLGTLESAPTTLKSIEERLGPKKTIPSKSMGTKTSSKVLSSSQVVLQQSSGRPAVKQIQKNSSSIPGNLITTPLSSKNILTTSQQPLSTGVDKAGSSRLTASSSSSKDEGALAPVLTKNQMELLELEMRARAIKAMLAAHEKKESQMQNFDEKEK